MLVQATATHSPFLDLQEAAGHLVAYWKLRLKLFQNRFTLPLAVVDGSGAMVQTDLEVLQMKIHLLLPADQFGRLVVYTDRSRWNGEEAHRTSVMRSLFYLVGTAAMEETWQKHGALLIVDLQRADVFDFCRKQSRVYLELFQDAKPFHTRTIHVTMAAPKSPASLLQPMVMAFCRPWFRARIVNHFGPPAKLDLSLKKYGISTQGLPPLLGGTFT
jgi:hypothetical protein